MTTVHVSSEVSNALASVGLGPVTGLPIVPAGQDPQAFYYQECINRGLHTKGAGRKPSVTVLQTMLTYGLNKGDAERRIATEAHNAAAKTAEERATRAEVNQTTPLPPVPSETPVATNAPVKTSAPQVPPVAPWSFALCIVAGIQVRVRWHFAESGVSVITERYSTERKVWDVSKSQMATSANANDTINATVENIRSSAELFGGVQKFSLGIALL